MHVAYVKPNHHSGSQTTKANELPFARLILPCLFGLLLTSCVVPGNPFEIIFPTVGVGYRTYTTLPGNYSGSTYYYNNRYYSGGRYENGNYYYRGAPYTGRYYHNGRYYYGGRYQYIGVPVRQPGRDYYNNQYGPNVRQSRY
jgi:hypothetical protein